MDQNGSKWTEWTCTLFLYSSWHDTTNAVVIYVITTAVRFLQRAASRRHGAVYRFLLVNSVANSEAVTTLSATASEDLAAIGSAHAVTETMLVSFLAV